MSHLHQALTEYVSTVRALGTQLRWPAQILRQFVNFMEQEGAAFIDSDLAVRWATQPVGVQPATWARRLSIVRRFAIWMQATDARTVIPPRGLLPAQRRRPTPYIFSDREIAQLMLEAGRLDSDTGLRPLTYATLIGLLATTGLRPGEALALDDQDVDLPGGILTVRETKFGKSRFVPVEESTGAALSRYVKERDDLWPRHRAGAFLLSERGTRLGKCSARRTFAMLSQKIGIRSVTHGRRIGRGPRLQDIRHTFATRKLVEWYQAGLDVERLVPGLSTYLGHREVHCTYWYIQAIPELLQFATERLAVLPSRGGS